MSKDFLKVYQIYFDDSQLQQLEFIPHKNTDCTVFFENTVIADLIEKGAHLDAEYFGVVSYQLRQKLQLTKRWRSDIGNISNTVFSPTLFEGFLQRHKPDVMSFQQHVGHDNVMYADRFHPNFSAFFAKIMQKIGYNWVPTHFESVVYCNFFVAKSEIYEKYVREMLIPAMKVMSEMPELMGNSNYPNKLRPELRAKFGVNHYPYHTFLCERMFSYFMHIHKYKCLNY